MDKWLEDNEAFLRLMYRLAVLGLLLWLVSAVDHADPSWYLSEMLELLRRR